MKKKPTDLVNFQKKKSQVIFLASQFFLLAGIDLFWPVLICISLLKICKSLMGDVVGGAPINRIFVF